MKRPLFWSQIAFAVCFIFNTFAATSPDIEMSDLAHSGSEAAFNMSSMQEALSNVNTLQNKSITLADFTESLRKKYSELQEDVDQLKLANPDLGNSREVANELETIKELIHNEDVVYFSYLATTQEFNEPCEVGPEAISSLNGFISTMCSEVDARMFVYEEKQRFVFHTIKARQKKRSIFFELLEKNQALALACKQIFEGKTYAISNDLFIEIATRLSRPAHSGMYDIATATGVETSQAYDIANECFQRCIWDFIDHSKTFPLLIKHFGDVIGIGIF